jgi:hypothetical protein
MKQVSKDKPFEQYHCLLFFICLSMLYCLTGCSLLYEPDFMLVNVETPALILPGKSSTEEEIEARFVWMGGG